MWATSSWSSWSDSSRATLHGESPSCVFPPIPAILHDHGPRGDQSSLRAHDQDASEAGLLRPAVRRHWQAVSRSQGRQWLQRVYPSGTHGKADSTLRASRAVPHPSTDRALCRLTSEVRRDPVYSTRYGRQRFNSSSSPSSKKKKKTTDEEEGEAPK